MTVFSPCDCPEARLLREWLTDPWAVPDAEMWPVVVALSEQVAVNRLRRMSHDLSAARDWSRIYPSHATDLQRRRVEPAGRLWREIQERHGGPYRGGPVDWSSGRPVREVAA